MQGFEVVRGKVRVHSRLIRKQTNSRPQQEVMVKYCGSKYLITKGVLDGIEEGVPRDIQNVYYIKEVFENE